MGCPCKNKKPVEVVKPETEEVKENKQEEKE